ncbi:TerC family protein [Dactylosporangium vinaceum]|uniref:TerC family protein n=1 Tax=Dactylosporangium vinaceum TaxID=53362 RepID=A0ABV5MQV4_9ACTN|nr:TerC family protein [Dactylosporangium vinaceum]UAB93863.1 TerC family protein [Dactylosporangium vinaceum]
MNVPFWMWAAVVAGILAMLAVDLLAHRRPHEVKPREAATWSIVWLSLGLGFGLLVWAGWGAGRAGEYYAGFLIEKSLAVDNVFVFALIFTAFAVPRAYQHRVLFYGVVGALIMRAVFIAAGAALITRFHWVLYAFGALLLYTAWKMYRTRNTHADPTTGRSWRLLTRVIPSTDEYHGQHFLIRQAGRWLATPLLLVLILVEITDLIFAVDSIPAIFAVTTEPFLVFTSNAFAILGLRALYFLLADLMHRFTHLKTGLAVILAFVGAKMLLIDVVKIPIGVSLGFITAVLAVSIVTSLRTSTNAPPTPAADDTRTHR